MSLPYQQPGLALRNGAANDKALVRALQRDLRALGYLRGGIDGDFGSGTEKAVRALQFDLLNNRGTGTDGNAPVAIADFNRDDAGAQRVTSVTGVLDQPLAACIDKLLGDAQVMKVPSAADPKGENARAQAAIAAAPSRIAPTPFIIAMMKQESSGQHFRVPSSKNDDNFVVVGLDRRKGQILLRKSPTRWARRAVTSFEGDGASCFVACSVGSSGFGAELPMPVLYSDPI